MDPSSSADPAVAASLNSPAHVVHVPLAESDPIQEVSTGLRTENVVRVENAAGEVVDVSGDEEGWESESAFEGSVEVEELDDGDLDGGDVCTLQEAQTYRRQLRDMGPEEFVKATVEADVVSAKKLLSAFGIRPPAFLEGAPDEAYYSLLAMALSRELHKRMKLPHYNTIDDVVGLMEKSKNIIVITGAGISTSLGIPDFRSKDTGLYSKLAHLGLGDPQDVFDIEIFREDPNIFYSIARDILPSTDRFSPTHAFIHLLQEKGKLLTNYSQNIDNIEATAGILPEKLVQCHGSFATASCIKCRAQVPGENIYPDLRAGKIPRCTRCMDTLRVANEPAAMKRKRSNNGLDAKKRSRNGDDDSDDDDDYDLPAAGVMKPDITFFGEALPDTFHDRLTKHDRDLADLVIVIGTSLKVAPVSEVVPYLPASVPQVYISRTPVSHVEFDVDMLGDCDVVVAELCRRAGWGLKHEMIPEDQEVDISLEDGFSSRYIFKVKEK